MNDVVLKEVFKWLDAGIVYTISDSKRLNLVLCVLKKGVMMVIPN